jgi:hypothetical protein
MGSGGVGGNQGRATRLHDEVAETARAVARLMVQPDGYQKTELEELDRRRAELYARIAAATPPPSGEPNDLSWRGSGW